MKSIFLPLSTLLVTAFAIPGVAALNVPLTVQEALYPGSVTGVARTNEPFCMGVPAADSANITNTNTLGLTGASAGQFRILGTWPDGKAKWIEVCGVVPSLNAGRTATVALTDSGSGNFGGQALAADNGATITINTTGGACGTAGVNCFSVRKAHFNGIDSATVGATQVVAPGNSQGFVILGPDPTAPYPGNVTCSPTSGGTACTTQYMSSNDPNSMCSIEKNGPVEAVLKCMFDHVDRAGHVYMHGTARIYFHQGKTAVKITSELRNADYGTSNTFATAYKGHQGYELRLTPNVSGTSKFTIANDTSTPTTGTLSGTDSVYLYQAKSKSMEWQDWCGFGCVPYTNDTGYSIVKNGAAIGSGTQTQYPQGWCDIADSNGTGVEIGVYQFAAYWPKSCEFNAGGTDTRIGIWARENSQPYYQSWPQHSVHDLFLNFHATAPASLPNEFLKLQHYLLAAASYTYYNDAKVFPYTLVDPAVEDNWYKATQASATSQSGAGISPSSACCIQDFGTSDTSHWPLSAYRYYAWSGTGGGTQTEFRWSRLLNYLSRGMTGRWLDSAQFYRFQVEQAWPHADGFRWTDHAGSEVDGFNQPTAASANSSLTFRNWRDGEHGHWYGMTDYYFLSGDETIKDTLMDGALGWFVNPITYQNASIGGKSYVVNTSGNSVTGTGFAPFFNDGTIYPGMQIFIGPPATGSLYTVASVADATHLTLTSSAGNQVSVAASTYNGLYNSRTIGVQLIGAARMADFLKSTGDSANAATVLQRASNTFTAQVKPDLCVSGYPAGCVSNTGSIDGGPFYAQGVSRVRGVPWGAAGTSGSWCGVSHAYRVNSSFQPAILIQGILEFRNAQGPGWPDYWNSLDLAYGISRWNLSELFIDDGTGHWDTNGFRFGLALDRANSCKGSGESPEPDYAGPVGTQTTAMTFLAKYLVDGDTGWATKFKINTLKDMSALGITTSDFGGYQLAHIISILDNPGSSTLNTVPIAGLTDNGGGSYTISWKVPAGAQYYRVKWSTKTIVDTIGYDPTNAVFTGNPATQANWWAANNADGIPAPAAPGSTQSMTITTGAMGLTAANFSVKAFSSASGTTGAPAALAVVSGNGQTGVPGQPLAGPLTVGVTDARGNPVPGVAVSFTVTSGGGAVAQMAVTTDNSGLASTTLTLGPSSGTNTVTAASGSLSPVVFTATGAGAGPANLVLVSGNNQTGAPGQRLASPFTVEVADSKGAPVAGVAVSFTITSGGGALTPATATTNSAGIASTSLTLGPASGTNTVSAASGSLSPISFTATGIAAVPTNLVMVSGNGQTGTAGQPLASPFTVQVTDSKGNPAAGVPVTFMVTAGGGTLTATSASTDATGLASTTLTLGSNPGTNTVAASSGSLAGSPITFTATGSQGQTGQPSVTWTQQTPTPGWPGWTGWLTLPFDPVSKQTMFYVAGAGGTGIYSTHLNFYNSATNTFTDIGGTSSMGDACPADTPTQPGDRHPVSQMAIDTKRNVFWMYGGVNQTCGEGFVSANGAAVTWSSGASQFPTNGALEGQIMTIGNNRYTIASVQDAQHLTLTSSAGTLTNSPFYVLTGSWANPRQDMYQMPLKAVPSADSWHQMNPAHFPAANAAASMVYDPDDDVLFVDGGMTNWVYCVTTDNPVPGTPTAAQLAAGCLNHDDWNQVSPAGGVYPPGVFFNGLAYDTVTKTIIMFGGNDGSLGVSYNQVWAYSVASKTWTQKGLKTAAPPVYNGPNVAQPAMAYDTATQKILYHQTHNSGAPADWQYDPAADTWTKLASSGGGPASDAYLSYDSKNNLLIGYSQDPKTGAGTVWQGALSPSGITPNVTGLSISIGSPAAASTLAGIVPVSATAAGGSVAGVQFRLDGSVLTAAVTASGATYNMQWDTTAVLNGTHTLTAIATSSSGSTAQNSISVIVNNAVPVPAISGVAAGSITGSGATISWTTDKPSDSSLNYGKSAGYGSASPVNSSPVTAHSVILSGLAASTVYHYQVLSRDAQGNLGSSPDFTFTTAGQNTGSQTVLQIHGNASEVSGVKNGSAITPGTAPAGFTGSVVVSGNGSVNFSPGAAGSGVYFLNCCDNANSAFYKFTGAAAGNIFNVKQGQISFDLKSRYSFGLRQSNAASPRFAFSVHNDATGNPLMYFFTQGASGSLAFSYSVGGGAQYYYAPRGTEDTLFGNGVVLHVTIAWDGATSKLYFNGTLVQSGSYTAPSPNWTTASTFALGANYYNGGFNALDDIIDEFTVSNSPVSPIACDLNGDGAVNVLDVQNAINQTLVPSSCKTGDLNGDGVCNSLDVQRVISATLGGVCKTGP